VRQAFWLRPGQRASGRQPLTLASSSRPAYDWRHNGDCTPAIPFLATPTRTFEYLPSVTCLGRVRKRRLRSMVPCGIFYGVSRVGIRCCTDVMSLAHGCIVLFDVRSPYGGTEAAAPVRKLTTTARTPREGLADAAPNRSTTAVYCMFAVTHPATPAHPTPAGAVCAILAGHRHASAAYFSQALSQASGVNTEQSTQCNVVFPQRGMQSFCSSGSRATVITTGANSSYRD
jgi:hypothetical protein